MRFISRLVVLVAATVSTTASAQVEAESFILSCLDQPSGPTTLSSADGKNFAVSGADSAGLFRIEIANGMGRIRYPASSFRPMCDRGDKEGWYKLEDVKVEPDRISFKYARNCLFSWNGEIDRLSGTMIIRGHVQGPCTPVTQERKF